MWPCRCPGAFTMSREPSPTRSRVCGSMPRGSQGALTSMLPETAVEEDSVARDAGFDCTKGFDSSIVWSRGSKSCSKKECVPFSGGVLPDKRSSEPGPTIKVLVGKAEGVPIWSQCTYPPISNWNIVPEKGKTHVREDNVVYIFRPQSALRQIFNNIRSRLYWPSAFYMLLNWCWICSQISSETEVEEDVCSFAGVAVDVLDEEGERWDCSTGV